MSKFFEALEQADRDRLVPTSGDGQGSGADVQLDPWLSADDTIAESSGGLENHLIALLAPSSLEAEQYRTLGCLLEQRSRTTESKVIGVSSPAVGDGKTLTAINLAGSLPQALQSRVLLLDADLRRSSVARYLAMDGTGPGLVRVILDERLKLADAAVRCPPFNLSVVPAGRHPAVTSEIWNSPRVGHLLEEARGQFDYIIVDLPPLLPIPDCRIIQRWIDGLLVVVAAHRTPRRLIEEALAVPDPGKIIGLVFNADDRPLSAYGQAYLKSDSRRSLWDRIRRGGRQGT
jgi:capsular exopolysaccharide synthesis family protein